MPLEPIHIINGIFSLAVICCFTIVGLKIALIYRKNKDKVYLLVGLAWMLLASPWYGSGTSFIVALFDGTQRGLMDYELVYFTLVVPLIPIALTILVTSITEIMFRPYRWKIRLIFLIFAIVMEILFIVYMIYFDSSLIIIVETPVNATYSRAIMYYILISALIVLLIGILLARSSIQLGTAEGKIRGYFLLIAFVLFVLGALFDSLLKDLIKQINILILLPRSLLIMSAFCFYLGFITPKFIKERLKKA
ncbi:MAG: hypothetical protein ACFFBP_11830 [Promethearchaeota archaeon]